MTYMDGLVREGIQKGAGVCVQKGGYICICVADSFLCTVELTQHFKAMIPQSFKKENLLRKGGVLLKVRDR